MLQIWIVQFFPRPRCVLAYCLYFDLRLHLTACSNFYLNTLSTNIRAVQNCTRLWRSLNVGRVRAHAVRTRNVIVTPVNCTMLTRGELRGNTVQHAAGVLC